MPFRTLYIDMNSFFASVEQHLQPELRGKPVAITAVDGTHGACVAASYEAKAYGVSTGTRVADAKQLCPGIIFLPSRHRVYVRHNLMIADILDQMGELERIRSVDEFQIALSGSTSTLEGARSLVQAMKKRVSLEIGPAIRFSAGIGPNELLAKIAGKLEKPDGFQWLSPSNMPERLAALALTGLPGISRGIGAKLDNANIKTIAQLHALDPRHARLIWGSIEGERFVRGLQGEPVKTLPTSRGGYGSSKVLSPEFRNIRAAYLVGRWLVGKASRRLRADKRVSARFGLSLHYLPEGGWRSNIKCLPSSDTTYFLRLHRELWRQALTQNPPRRNAPNLISLTVQLGDVSLLVDRTGDLLSALRPGERSRGENASATADLINNRFGSGTIKFGVDQPHPGFFERG